MRTRFFTDIFSPFAWIFADLFTPPYSIIGVFMIAMLLLCVVVFCVTVYAHICLHANNCDVNRFFEEHEATSGTILGYEIEEIKGHTIPAPIMPGMSPIVVPRFVSGRTYFTITLDCHAAGEHFHARYEIPEEDFKQHKRGDRISIGDNWDPLGYEVV